MDKKERERADAAQKAMMTRRTLVKTSLAAAGAAALAMSPRQASANVGPTLVPKFFPLDSFTPDVDLTGKVAVITGASRGMGLATGQALTALGVQVIGTSRDVKTVPSMPAYPLLDLDITDSNSVDHFMKDLHKVLAGRKVDILINNAGRGVWGPVMPPSPADKQKYDYYFSQIELATRTTYLGHLGMTGQIMPLMPATGYARILFTVSSAQYWVGGVLAPPMFPGGPTLSVFQGSMQPYYSAKRGLFAYANFLRARLAAIGSNIQVSTLNPNAVNTDIMKGTRPIFLEPVDEQGYSGDPESDGYLDMMRAALNGGNPYIPFGPALPPADFPAKAYGQLLRMANPPPNVIAGGAAEPAATQGQNAAAASEIFAENGEGAFTWSCS